MHDNVGMIEFSQACRTGADIALLEDEIQRNTTPAYRAPEVYCRGQIGPWRRVRLLCCLAIHPPFYKEASLPPLA